MRPSGAQMTSTLRPAISFNLSERLQDPSVNNAYAFSQQAFSTRSTCFQPPIKVSATTTGGMSSICSMGAPSLPATVVSSIPNSEVMSYPPTMQSLQSQYTAAPSSTTSAVPLMSVRSGQYGSQSNISSTTIPQDTSTLGTSSISASSSTNAVVGGPAVLAPRQKVHLRKAAATVWSDSTLDDWPDEDYRVFCGDLGNEVTDELLSNAFRHIKSFQRARVIRDKRTGKGKGFGFVSFGQPEDMLRAIKEMDRKYVGNRPIRVMKSKWRDREVDSEKNKRAPEPTLPIKSKELKKFKPMKPVTGGKKVALTPTAPVPNPTVVGNTGFRGRGYRGPRPPPFSQPPR